MSNEIALANVGDTVRDKLRQILLDALPKETLDAMVKKEFDEFFNGKEGGNTWDRQRECYYKESEFSTMIKAEMHEIMKIQVKALVADRVKITEEMGYAAFTKLVTELTPTIWAAAQSEMSKTVVEAIVHAFGYRVPHAQRDQYGNVVGQMHHGR